MYFQQLSRYLCKLHFKFNDLRLVMKKQLSGFFLLFLILCVSCIQDEPLSPYADIEAFSFPDEIALTDATINQTQISVYVRKGTDLSAIVPDILLSEGATIEPSIQTPRDFRTTVSYTVTAADGVHQREYTIQTIQYSQYNFNFENWEKLDKSANYETPVEYDIAGKRTSPWDSSNKGINIYKQYASPDLFPVHKTSTAANGTFGAEMITQKGPGDIWGMTYIPIAAGSLFLGVLNPLNAMKDPLTATQFGQPFYDKPLRLKGNYIYKAGTGDYIAPNGEALPGVKDSCAIYSVFYITDMNLNRLDGTNVLTHPNIVALAMLPPEGRAGSPGDGFVSFDLEFQYTANHIVDFEKNDYKLAIVFASSYYGDRYEGVPGSRLVVDDVEIIIEE